VARIFVDSAHYIAALLPKDRLHEAAIDTANALRGSDFVTSDAVMMEVLAYVCERGANARDRAVRLVRLLRADTGTLVVPQTREPFDAGLDLYARRPDKGYSLTDAISMVICDGHGITQVLTHDRQFEQEGYEILL
jgi:predicted nucleic acid-binding protein